MSDKLKLAVMNKPRRRQALGRLNGRLVAIAVTMLFCAMSAGGGWWVWTTGTMERAVGEAHWQLVSISLSAGLKVEEILVVGRNETKREDLLKAIRVARGMPILTIDLDAARRRVEALPWVHRASVERILPDTILLNVEEREPIALWQHNGKFALIDGKGEVILNTGLQRFSDLVVVVGKEAPMHASELLNLLAAAPELMPMVKAAVWVGGRRWDLRLKNDIDVRLPEEDPAAAWMRLAEYEKAHRVLERDVQVLDLRAPDRLIVRKARRPIGKVGKGRET
mgnify:CR=1 FL=1